MCARLAQSRRDKSCGGDGGDGIEKLDRFWYTVVMSDEEVLSSEQLEAIRVAQERAVAAKRRAVADPQDAEKWGVKDGNVVGQQINDRTDPKLKDPTKK